MAAANNSRALGEMEGAAAAYKELADSYRETLAELKAEHAATKEELKAERAAHAVTKAELGLTKAELDQLKAAGTKRPAEAAASPPATKQRLSEDAPPPGPPGGGFVSQRPNGKFLPEEDEAYRALLKQYGQPCKDNPQPWVAAFGQVFPNRTLPSLTAHVNAFNKSEYEAWQGMNGGLWAGFDWRLIKK